MIRVLLILTYALASIMLGGIAGLYQGLSTGIFCGVLALLFMLQIGFRHACAVVSARRTKPRSSASSARNAAMEKAVAETRAKMEEVTKAVEARANAQGKKIVSELQVLESLMREFAGKISQKAAQPKRTMTCAITSAARAIPTPPYLDRYWPNRNSWKPSARGWKKTAWTSIYSPSSACRSAACAITRRLSRLRAQDGSVIMPAQYIKIAAPAGLMSVVDNLLLFRCVQVVRRLISEKTRKVIGIFCNISGDTLADVEFFPQFLDYMQVNRDLAGQIIFEFAQDAVLEGRPRRRTQSAPVIWGKWALPFHGPCEDLGAGFPAPEDAGLQPYQGACRHASCAAWAAPMPPLPPKTSRSCSPATVST